MVSSTTTEVFYTGNGSTVTGYSVPFTYLSASHVKVGVLAAGSGTVTVTAGAAVFSASQSTLEIGSRIRIAGTVYTIATRTSDTAFTFTTRRTISASAFHILDDATALVSGSTFTLVESGVGAPYVTTATAYASTYLVRVYREVPLTQLIDFESTGPVPTESIEQGLDLGVMRDQQLSNRINDLAIITAAAAATTANDTTTFANTAARTAATPTRIGQFGVQLDTRAVYTGTATTAGSWVLATQSPAARTFATLALLQAATPDYVGQLAQVTAAHLYKGFYISNGLTVGAWGGATPTLTFNNWPALGWTAAEELLTGQYRWVGLMPCNMYVRQLYVATDTPGAGTLSVKVYHSHSSGTPVSMTTATMTIDNTSTNTAAGTTGSGALFELAVGIQGEASDSYVRAGSRIEIEIVSIGTSTTTDTSAGSPIFTIPSVSTLKLGTGTIIKAPTHGDVWVLATRGDGTVVVSNAAPATASGAAVVYGGRHFVRGIMGITALSGATTITVTATDAGLIRVGDWVIGDAVHPDTVVTANNGTNTITISHPLLGDTSQVAFLTDRRPPVMHHTVISESGGATTIDVGTVQFHKVGDTVLGTNVAASTHITAVGASSFDINNALSGAITEITVVYPIRSSTGTAGATTLTVASGTGLLVGTKAEGPGIPADTFVTAVSGVTVTLSNPLATDLTAMNVQFTRDVLQHTASINTTTTVTLPVATSTTAIEVGMEVTGTGIAAGTFVSAVGGGSTITLTRSATATNAAAVLRFARTATWRGLHINLSGWMTQV